MASEVVDDLRGVADNIGHVTNTPKTVDNCVCVAPVDAWNTSCIFAPFGNFIASPDANDQAIVGPEIELTKSYTADLA